MQKHQLSISQYLIIAYVSISVPLGDACLKKGMSQLPVIDIHHPAGLIAAIFTPWVALGILFLLSYFASYLTAVSWADLTYVMPATAIGNVFIALLAHFWIGEPISILRWIGVVLITVGVGLAANGPASTTPPLNGEAEDAQ